MVLHDGTKSKIKNKIVSLMFVFKAICFTSFPDFFGVGSPPCDVKNMKTIAKQLEIQRVLFSALMTANIKKCFAF